VLQLTCHFHGLSKGMAGTTGLEPAASAVTGQRSNQLNYVPTCFSSGWWETRNFAVHSRRSQRFPAYQFRGFYRQKIDMKQSAEFRPEALAPRNICPCPVKQIVTEESQINGTRTAKNPTIRSPIGAANRISVQQPDAKSCDSYRAIIGTMPGRIAVTQFSCSAETYSASGIQINGRSIGSGRRLSRAVFGRPGPARESWEKLRTRPAAVLANALLDLLH
jgi:hypothetical protein